MSLNPMAEVKLTLAAISGVPEPNAEKLRRVRKQISKRLENVANGELLAVAQKLIDADRRWIGYDSSVGIRNVCDRCSFTMSKRWVRTSIPGRPLMLLLYTSRDFAIAYGTKNPGRDRLFLVNPARSPRE